MALLMSGEKVERDAPGTIVYSQMRELKNICRTSQENIGDLGNVFAVKQGVKIVIEETIEMEKELFQAKFCIDCRTEVYYDVLKICWLYIGREQFFQLFGLFVSREKSLKLRLVCAVLCTLYVLEISTTRNVQDCTEI